MENIKRLSKIYKKYSESIKNNPLVCKKYVLSLLLMLKMSTIDYSAFSNDFTGTYICIKNNSFMYLLTFNVE